ncbi:hypothetical protein CROQUDRAFT_81635 [Cronartium quercuum f. sp. fusiforme G11]|uniref:sphinganine-1-phosphate aldolase n=1 Tax=Cronartium quercuum f. sp. fusiforme G11 TaxID=708437 RepID=A0A9P6T8D9_9BASI|nr:hypothetical protein CROQUDRAFT_81635 [Cronartium quercuum f. sp. fusiforme G11]
MSLASYLPTTRLTQINRNDLTELLTFGSLRSAVFWYVVWKSSVRCLRHLRSRGIRTTIAELQTQIMIFGFNLLLKVPSFNEKVMSQLDQGSVDIEKKLAPKRPGIVRWLSLPSEGKSVDWLKDELEALASLPSTDWKEGKVSGAVYHGGADLAEVIGLAFSKYMISNPLHPDIFPGVRKMEAEVVRMVLDLYNVPTNEGAGTTTSGGTESILMACKTYRDWARDVKGITEPEMVIPISAHAAFDKAGEYFGIKVHHIPVDPQSRKVNVARVKRAINSNTIMLVGSAPNFPDGAIDDIVGLGKLAKKYKIGLHVDCCLGSFLVPFIEQCGFPMDPFDFRVEGVTSISCDTHKYGFAPKGSSVIMYRSVTWRKYQYSVLTTWPGGVYASPSIAGSRPGALIAGAWAALMYMGKDGYLNSCKEIIGCAKKLEQAIRDEIPELEILGNPLVSVVAFKTKKGSNVDIYQLGDHLSSRGWHLNALQNPPALHIACTRPTVPAIDGLIIDLKAGIEKVKTESGETKGDMVTLYGLGSSSSIGPGLVADLAKRYLDVLYSA